MAAAAFGPIAVALCWAAAASPAWRVDVGEERTRWEICLETGPGEIAFQLVSRAEASLRLDGELLLRATAAAIARSHGTRTTPGPGWHHVELLVGVEPPENGAGVLLASLRGELPAPLRGGNTRAVRDGPRPCAD